MRLLVWKPSCLRPLLRSLARQDPKTRTKCTGGRCRKPCRYLKLDDSAAQTKAAEGGDEKITHKKMMKNHDGDGGDVDGDGYCWWWLLVMNVGQISKFHNLMFFPAGSLLQGWRLGDGQHHAFTHRRLYRGALTHRRVYTQQLLHSWALRRGAFYAQTGLHAAAFTQSSYCTQKASHRGALHRGGFTDRSFYRQKLLHTEAFAQSGFCTEGL